MYTYNLFKYSNCCSASDSNKDTYYFLINPDEDEKLSEMASLVSEGAFRSVFRLTHWYQFEKTPQKLDIPRGVIIFLELR